MLRLSIKKSMFPVHRVGEIEASRAAAILFVFFIFFSLFFFVGNFESIVHFWGGKMEKKSPVAPFLATRPLHWKQNYFYGQPQAF